jgi:non-ribosomal peptide synthetase component F
MQGEQKVFNNDYNLFDYFSKITLMQTNEKPILKEKAIFRTKFEKGKSVQFTFEEVFQHVTKFNNFMFEAINFENDSEKQDKRLVGVYLKTDEYTVQILMGILSLGLTYLPIDPTMPKERINYILNDAKPLCVISNINNDKTDDFFNGTSVYFLKDIFNKEDNIKENKNINNLFEYDPNSAACLIYTSGSTGLPKGVLISHKSIMNRLNWQWSTFNISTENQDVGALKTSLNFVDHIAEIFAFILKGLPLCIISPEVLSSPLQLLNTIEKFKITYFICVPSLLKNIITIAVASKLTAKLNSVKRWICSGEELTMSLMNSFWDMNLNNGTIMSNFYGSTELTADLTFVSFDSQDQMRRLLNKDNRLPIGRPLSNSKFYLFDENLNKVEGEEEIGEIYAGGIALAIGYLHDEKIESRFININNERLF